MVRPKLDKRFRPSRSRIVVLLLFLLLLYIVVPQFDIFSGGVAVLRRAELAPIMLALCCMAITYMTAAGIYQLLALKPLHFGQTIAVQGASAFTNRLLPAGLGSLALNVQYLRRRGHRLPMALAIGACNNLLGLIGHSILLAIAFLAGGGQVLGQLAAADISYWWYVIVALLLIVLAGLLALQGVRSYLKGFVIDVWAVLEVYKRHAGRLVAALCCSMLLTLLYITVFYLSAHAVGVSLSVMQAVVIFTLGMFAGTVTPTPGGLGGAEAGLVAGSLAYGHDASAALAAALLYRLLTYWLPLLPGLGIFLAIRNRYI